MSPRRFLQEPTAPIHSGAPFRELTEHMNKIVALLFVSTLLVSSRAGASGPQQCQIRVLAPITDDLGNTWKTGSVLAVDIERDGPNGGAFCAHGGSCLPRMAGAQTVLTLLNCKVGPALGGGDFRLVPERSGAVRHQQPSFSGSSTPQPN